MSLLLLASLRAFSAPAIANTDRVVLQYGPVKSVTLVYDTLTQKPRGYGFVEFEHERDMKTAYKHADGRKIDGRRVLVDVERGRTVKDWKPRRLGQGLGSSRKDRAKQTKAEKAEKRRQEQLKARAAARAAKEAAERAARPAPAAPPPVVRRDDDRSSRRDDRGSDRDRGGDYRSSGGDYRGGDRGGDRGERRGYPSMADSNASRFGRGDEPSRADAGPWRR